VNGILQPQKDFNIPSHILNEILMTIGTTSIQSENAASRANSTVQVGLMMARI
jgi:hypothetical protein